MTGMNLGVTIFLTDLSIGPIELAREVEARGFSSVWLPEHTHIPTSRRTPAPMGEPLDEEYRRCLDPFVTMGMMTAVTDRIRLGTGISLLAERDPIVTAKEVATLDHVSNGRISLGIGYGWNIEELENHGGSKKTRRAVVRERILAMQELWGTEAAAFHGDHVQMEEAWAWPKPKQQVQGRTGVPVLVGGAPGPILFQHIAEFADGWIPIGGAGVAAAMADLHAAADEAGRDPSELTVIPFGTLPDQGKLDHYQTLGITETVLRLPSAGRDEVLRVLDSYVPFLDR
ncbi:MAG TPA: TIGR03619 family F420-dependent LLM class oxidoreductase [Acidimicrobiales bacterium]|nr:TIGR03619 family F420-dependent LLM class oxidoreductase [Acidimicrobiales bacterium]